MDCPGVCRDGLSAVRFHRLSDFLRRVSHVVHHVKSVFGHPIATGLDHCVNGIAVRSLEPKVRSCAAERIVAWYWPQIHGRESARAAVVNAIGCSVLLALMMAGSGFGLSLSFTQRIRRASIPLIIAAAAFALAGWGIRRRCRIAAVTAAFSWFLRLGFILPRILPVVLRSGDAFGVIWPFLCFLIFCFCTSTSPRSAPRSLTIVCSRSLLDSGH